MKHSIGSKYGTVLATVSLAVALAGSALVCSSTLAADQMKNAKDPVVVVDTNKGKITMEIYKSDAPITANNFLDLVGRKFYDGLVFHRVEDWVVQGGDPTGTGGGGFNDPKTHKERTIPLEIKGLSHTRGTVAMARTSDPNSASSQWYVVKKDSKFLDSGYAIFGHVIDGMSVIDNLSQGDKMTKVYVRAAK